jgi:hypothetical protein
MMNSDEVPRSTPPYPQGRKPYQPKFQDTRYSPSSSFNYNSNSSYPSSQHQRKRFDRFKRDTNGNNGNERLMRQNDLIIRLLKEIRDRLPPPAVPAHAEAVETDAVRQNGQVGEVERTESPKMEQQEPEPAPAGNSSDAQFSAGSQVPAPEASIIPEEIGNPEGSAHGE